MKRKKLMIGILAGIAAIIALPLTAALFVKNDYTIEREIVINKPKNQVFDYVKHIRNQENFSKWVMRDPGMKKDFHGNDGEVGFVYAWDSKDKGAGAGEQEIKGITEGEKVDLEVRFERPFKNVARTPFTVESVSENQTKVKWSMIGRNAYPMNLMTLFLGGILGKDIETSLGNLKGILEKQ
ncbi:MAG: polyketide cyclase [Sphingobacteriales bacterium]|nr:MAG: polyketide cyclase [Sphingobacteriales bacterium]